MYTLYILHNPILDRYYIGQTSDIKKRVERHNKGYVKSTKGYRPWILVYQEKYEARSEVMAREQYLKSLKSKAKIKELVDTSR